MSRSRLMLLCVTGLWLGYLTIGFLQGIAQDSPLASYSTSEIQQPLISSPLFKGIEQLEDAVDQFKQSLRHYLARFAGDRHYPICRGQPLRLSSSPQ